VLTVSVKDDDKVLAEKYRQAFVDVFTKVYVELDCLIRRRFVAKKQQVVDEFNKQYDEVYAKLKPLAEAKGLPVDVIVRPSSITRSGLEDELNRQEADLRAELALATSGATRDTAREAQINGAIKSLQTYRMSLSPSTFDPQLRELVDEVHTLGDLRNESYVRLNNARGAVVSAQSDIETSYSFSGGLSGSNVGRVAIALAVTVIFGLIAIYTIEWLTQIRSHSQDL
jgi:hypothetical protein